MNELGRWVVGAGLACCFAGASACSPKERPIGTGDAGDAGQDTSGTAGSGTTVGGSSTGGTSTGGGGASGASGNGTGGGSGTAGSAPGNVCVPDQPLCDGDRATHCNEDGTGFVADGEQCTSEQVCLLGSCADLECVPSTTFCSGNGVRQCDESGLSSEEQQLCGSGEYCDVASATCKTGVCAPGQPACDGNRATTCNSVGGGYESGGTTCQASETCDAGACKPQVCAPDDTFCQGQTVKTCSENGLSSSVIDTCQGQTCVKAGADAGCEGECAPNERRCSGNRPQQCDANGAYTNDGTACSANGTCNGSTTACQCKPGYFGNGVTCTACAAGTYSAAGATSCTACAVGTYSAAAATSCTACAAGTWDNDANPATTCKSCATCGAATGTYESAACTATTNRVCKAFPSCEGLASSCGASANDNCCASPTVTGGTFTFGSSTAGTVASFALDKYEVTVGRFRKFVAAFSGAPDSGDGAHPLIAGSGWQSAWDSSIAPNSPNLVAGLSCSSSFQTWRDAAGTTESVPINCIDWYEAFAFCAWDGGRLPTEAEWEYAAKGGSENRTYPWGSTPVPSSANVLYNCNGNGDADCVFEDILRVGSKPSGAGRYAQLDLFGSMFEWTLDSYAALPATCNNCARVTTGDRVFRGGAWSFSDTFLSSTARRDVDSATARYDVFGFRCARTP
jgi:formylglycine-generating enzyme required for sulfatase activity